MHLCAVVERVAIINIKDAKGGILILVDNGPLMLALPYLAILCVID